LAGNADSFGLLFERHGRAVYNFAFRRTANWAAAEDAASEVFLVARTVYTTVGSEPSLT
jgi:DNA-directed RNA polymerase specialized sigma24 family protein